MLCKKCKREIAENSVYCSFCGKKQLHTESTTRSRKRANGFGTVYKLSGNRKRPWAAARNKVMIGYYSTKAEALASLEALQGKRLPDWYNITLEELYDKWRNQKEFRQLSDKGQESYTTTWKNLSPLAGRKFRDLRPADYQEIIDNKSGSYSAKSKIRILISQLCKFAIMNDIIDKNYAPVLRIGRKTENTEEKKIFTAKDIQKLFSAAESDSTAKIVLILIYTGMRINELFDLKKTDVFLDGRTPHFVGGEKTEAGKNRFIPIALPILSYVQNFMEQDGIYLICGEKGGRMNYGFFRDKRYYPLLERLGIEPITMHKTRHTFASMMVKAGARPEDLQQIIGHADYSTTANIYNHADPEQLTEAINQLSGY